VQDRSCTFERDVSEGRIAGTGFEALVGTLARDDLTKPAEDEDVAWRVTGRT